MPRPFYLVPLLAAASCSEQALHEPEPEAVRTFVGSDGCSDCHFAEYESWMGSHHQLAMQVVTTENVLGDFNGASIDTM